MAEASAARHLRQKGSSRKSIVIQILFCCGVCMYVGGTFCPRADRNNPQDQRQFSKERSRLAVGETGEEARSGFRWACPASRQTDRRLHSPGHQGAPPANLKTQASRGRQNCPSSHWFPPHFPMSRLRRTLNSARSNHEEPLATGTGPSFPFRHVGNESVASKSIFLRVLKIRNVTVFYPMVRDNTTMGLYTDCISVQISHEFPTSRTTIAPITRNKLSSYPRNDRL